MVNETPHPRTSAFPQHGKGFATKQARSSSPSNHWISTVLDAIGSSTSSLRWLPICKNGEVFVQVNLSKPIARRVHDRQLDLKRALGFSP